MDIKQIDGKRYVEYSLYKTQRRKTIMSVAFIVAIIIASYAMISSIQTLLENKEIIQKDPLRYGMDVHGFVSCQCFDAEGKDWISKDSGFLHTSRGEDWINYSEPFNLTKFEVIDGTSGSN